MKLNTRARGIIQTLLKKEQAYITTGSIAEEIGVSAKTVTRELDEVARVLAECGLELEKKTGSGLGIKGSPENLANLRTLLQESKEDHIYSPEERQSIIISQLLTRQGPIKLYVFATKLNVSEGTVSKDLDKLGPWLKEQGLELVRKPGLGVYLQGEEKRIRRAIIEYIYANIGEDALLSLMKDSFADKADENAASATEGSAISEENRQGIRRYMLDLVDESIVRTLEELVKGLDKKLDTQLSDNAFIGLVVHLSLAVQRIRKNEKISIDKDALSDLREKKEFRVAAYLGEQIAAKFGISVPEDEVGYITMHLLGARNRYKKDKVSTPVMDNFHLVKLAKGIMSRAEEFSGKRIQTNQGLLVGLVNHLGPSISRLKMDMPIRNPLLEEMEEQYPELMRICRYAVKDLEELLGMEMPQSEVAYIAMHLNAALEEGEALPKLEWRVIVACPTGMGTSRMLAGRLRSEYSRLKIIDQTSTFQLYEEYLKNSKADFIISTVPIPHAALPVVVVSPLLREADRDIIERQMDALHQGRRREEEAKAKAKVRPSFKDALAELTIYSSSIAGLLDGFFFINEETFNNMEEICYRVGEIAGADAESAEGIAKALIKRESYGGTMVWGHGIVLLHCQSEYVLHVQIGIIHTGERFAYNDTSHEKPRTVIAMVAPQAAKPQEKESISYISSILLDRWGLIEILHEGDNKLIYQELEKIFRGFFQEKYKALMEG